jgi:hypothetical protein
MSELEFFTPVLFLIFNRPDTTQAVFDEIRKIKPKKLFIAADGPRKEHPEDVSLCQKTREIVDQVDWDCNLSTLFREENLGCKYAVSSAIDWFFSHVEEGIILEDDCVPDQSFFPFCDELLEKYRYDERVMMISGTNIISKKFEIPESYYFSQLYLIWGWATWKRSWSLYDIQMSNWPLYNSLKYLNYIYHDKRMVLYLKKMLNETYDHHLNTWDVQWVYSCIFNHGLSICPKFNLISNIGNIGIHTCDKGPLHDLTRKPIDPYRLIHPGNIVPNFKMDNNSYNEIFKYELVSMKIYNFMRKLKKRIEVFK